MKFLIKTPANNLHVKQLIRYIILACYCFHFVACKSDPITERVVEEISACCHKDISKNKIKVNKVNSYYLGTVNDNEETDGMYFVGHLDLTGKLKIIRIHEAKQNDHSTEFHKTLIRANNLLSGIDLYIGDVYYSDSISVSLVTKSLHSNLGIATFKDYQLLTELSNYYLGYRQLSDTLKSFMAK